MSPGTGRFAASVAFAALAALSFTPVLTACDPRDSTILATLYLTLLVAAYSVLVAHDRPVPLAALGLIVGAGLLSCLASTLTPAAVTLTVALGVGRSWLLFPRRFDSPLPVEVGLASAALAVVLITVRPSHGGISLAVWAFFLVQSAFFLVPARRAETRNAATAPVAASEMADRVDSAPEGAQQLGGS